MSEHTPKTIGKYDIVREIGRGNMARVFLADDPFAGRQVAIKVANPAALAKNNKAGRRRRKLFFNEARAAGLLKHPNIVTVYDVGVEDDFKYIVMEYVPGGETLFDYCQADNLLPVENVVRILLQCAAALDYAHRKGVVHRDIKPRNLLLDENQIVKISDFGVALLSGEAAEDTQIHGYLGSPLYMSPEQLRGESVGGQSDLFSLGIVAYELLTGRHPFAAENLPAVTHRIAHEPHVPLHELRPDVPPVLEHVIDRVLKKHPAGRYQMGLDLAGDLGLIFDEITLSQEELSGGDKLELVQGLAFFRRFQEAEIWEVINASVFRDFEPGAEIVTEGEEANAFYVLVSGHATVRRGGEEVDVLSVGECFGEIGMVAGTKRTASVAARGECTCLMVRASLIERTSLNCQLSFQKAFVSTLAERLTRAMGRIVEIGHPPGPPVPRVAPGRPWPMGE